MNCQHVRTAIDTASPREPFGETVSLHLAGCDGCRDYAGQMTALFALMNDVPRVEAPGDFDFRLRAKIAQAKAAQAPQRGVGILSRFWVQSFSWAQASAAMAAVALLVSFGTYLSVRKNSPQINQPEATIAAHSTPAPQPSVTPSQVPDISREITLSPQLPGPVAVSNASGPLRQVKPSPLSAGTPRRMNREMAANPGAVTERSIPEINTPDVPPAIIVNQGGRKIVYLPVTLPVTLGAQSVSTKAEPKVSSGVTVF